jgi:hypothetical protein
MFKKVVLALALSPLFISTGFAEGVVVDCVKKCSPARCGKVMSRVPVCKVECPDQFDACYAAVPDAKKPSVDAALAAIEDAMDEAAAAAADAAGM